MPDLTTTPRERAQYHQERACSLQHAALDFRAAGDDEQARACAARARQALGWSAAVEGEWTP